MPTIARGASTARLPDGLISGRNQSDNSILPVPGPFAITRRERGSLRLIDCLADRTMKDIAIIGLMLALAFPVVSEEKEIWQEPMYTSPILDEHVREYIREYMREYRAERCNSVDINIEANALMRLRSAINNNDNDYLRRIAHMLRPETMETILRIFKIPGSTRSSITSELSKLGKDLRAEARAKAIECRVGPFMERQ